jgi:hypothetical protein
MIITGILRLSIAFLTAAMGAALLLNISPRFPPVFILPYNKPVKENSLLKKGVTPWKPNRIST